MKKSGILSRIAYWIIGLSLVFGGVAFEDAIISFHKPIDIYADDFAGVKRMTAVKSDLDLILPGFLEETVTHTKNGSTTRVDRYNYYSVPVFVGDDCYYVALKTPSNTDNDNQIKKVVKETTAYLNYRQDTYGAEIFEFQGGVYKTKKNIYNGMKSWFKESGFFENDADVEKYVLPYQLEPIASFQTMRTIFIVCVAALLVGILMIVIDRKVISAKSQE